MDIEEKLKQLTLEEKVALVAGTNFMYTNPVKRLGIHSVRMSDGPHGLRVQQEGGDNGVSGSAPSTCFPTAATTASSWNPENVYKMGKAMGHEALHYGINVILGPGICIKRNPLCGRNFEYFSEDPILAGRMGAAEVKGIQSMNVGASLKHFALNNAENYRFMGDSICDMRAIREIYLRAFEHTVKEAKPHTVMCSYNKINGTYACENEWLLNKTLRNEWGFDGLVMSDWGATHNRVKGIEAGLDLEMPGDTLICRKWLMDAVKNGSLSEEKLNTAVRNVLTLSERYEKNPKNIEVDWKAHNELAAEIALDSAVLLKNDKVLPLSLKDNILVVGDLFTKMRYQGAGSSMIQPTELTTPKDAFDKNGVVYTYCRGYSENKLEPEDSLITEAIEKAKSFDKIIVFAGLTDYVESEGCDRENMCLPNNQIELIQRLATTGKKIIVVLFGGSPVELPFQDSVAAILNMYLPGQAGGLAAYKLLFGIQSPSGKLAETWVKKYSDVPLGNDYSKNQNELYKESIFVGYRYYSTKKVEVNYPFGYGLSYTKFKYDNIQLTKNKDSYTITCDVKNIGDYAGAEIVELYVKGPKGILKPLKELKGFTKVYLEKGETKEATILVSLEDLKYWNSKENRWVLEDGEYQFEISSSSETCELSISEQIQGEKLESFYTERVEKLYQSLDFSFGTDEVYEELIGNKLPTLPPRMPITIESRFSNMAKSRLMGRIIYKAVLNVAKKQMKEAKKLPEGAEKENKIKGAIFLERILNTNSLDTMAMCGGNSMPFNFAEGFMHFGNGKLFKGIKCFTTKIEAPELPKNKEENQ